VSLMGHLAPTSSSPFGAIPEGEDSSQQLSATNSANVGKPGPAAGPSYVSPFAGGSQVPFRARSAPPLLGQRASRCPFGTRSAALPPLSFTLATVLPRRLAHPDSPTQATVTATRAGSSAPPVCPSRQRLDCHGRGPARRQPLGRPHVPGASPPGRPRLPLPPAFLHRPCRPQLTAASILSCP
jgi:hypothetical protein